MLEEIATTTLSDVALREPVRVESNTRLLDVVARLRERSRGSAFVEDESGALRGIFTERDLMLRVDHSSHAWHDLAVSEVMTADPVTVSPAESLATALERMSRGGFRHLPVVDDAGHATAVVSIRDILTHIAEFFPEEFINLPPNPESEASGRWGG